MREGHLITIYINTVSLKSAVDAAVEAHRHHASGGDTCFCFDDDNDDDVSAHDPNDEDVAVE